MVWGWEKLRAKTQDFSPVSAEDGVCGPEAFSKVSPSALKCPSSSGSGSCQQDISREQRHQCPSIYRNREAPGLPAHPQESHSKSDLKSHSLGRVWSFFVSARKDSTFLTLQPAQSSAGSGAGRLLDGITHCKSCFCCTWWAHPKLTTLISGP